eukprot:324541-Prymnesium_polylepis.2
MAFTAALFVFFAFQRSLVCLPSARGFLLAALLLAESLSRPMSDFGPPKENLFVASAALAAELLGDPLEATIRLRFLRRSMEEEAVPLARVTLRLPGDEERAYVATRFTESYPLVVRVCFAFMATCIVLSVAWPNLVLGNVLSELFLSLMLLLRRRLSYSPDQFRAAQIFSWSWCGLFTLQHAIAGIANQHQMFVVGMGWGS